MICPYCKSENVTTQYYTNKLAGVRVFFVICTDCWMRGPEKDSNVDARRAFRSLRLNRKWKKVGVVE